jgi:hypothetical protein
MRNILLMAIVLSLRAGVALPATTWYVDGSVAGSGNGQSWETSFRTIQEGIDAASDGDTVIVAEGTYLENIQFNGKSVILRSSDPFSPDVVAATIIDGSNAGAVVSFKGTENATCALSGFTIRNGLQMVELGGGGIYGAHTHAAIVNNRIVNNGSLGDGGGLYACDGMVANNIISGNSTPAGGGLSTCDGTIENNIVVGNYCSSLGGGFFQCNGIIRNNTIYGNSGWGAPLIGCKGTILNCIIWGNGGEDQLWESSLPDYSCIEGLTQGGEGNISLHPHFVDPENGDFHLRTWSPCIDAGDPSSDFSNEPRPNGGRVDIGAYGNTPEATSKSPDADADGLPDDWEVRWFGGLESTADSDPDGDLVPNIREYGYGLNPTAAEEGLVYNLTKDELYRSIQTALSKADHGEEIVVYPGAYMENVSFGGKNVVLRSTDPLSPAVVANTIIDGNQAGSVVTFSGTEDETCLLSGFTIRNGRSRTGAGICGGSMEQRTLATIRNNVIAENVTYGNEYPDGCGGGLAYCNGIIMGNTITLNSGVGGGLYECDGAILDNTITLNSAAWGTAGLPTGGGLCYCRGLVQGNVIAGNNADYEGGGLHGCTGRVRDNIIVGNAAGTGGGLAYCGEIRDNVVSRNGAASGGGLAHCMGLIQGNVISANWADEGGGLFECSGTIQNNIVSGNWGGTEGAGLTKCSGTIANNTIAGNRCVGGNGGGINQCGARIVNSIIWDNTAAFDSQLYRSATPAHCCIEGWNGSGEGNISDDPLFVVTPSGGGRWTADGSFDNKTWQTSLTDTAASWQPDALKGLLVNPDTAEAFQFVIASNTATTMNVWGDASNLAKVNQAYEIYDYRLVATSPCVDAGDNAVDAGRFDLEGGYRRISTKGKAGWSRSVDYIVKDEAAAITLLWKGFIDIGAYECQVFGEVPETFAVETTESMESGDWIEVFSGKVCTWSDHETTGRAKFYRVHMK